MYKFNVNRFADSVMASVVEQADRAKKKQETELLVKMQDTIDKMVMLASWTNRRWNLISSFVGVVFYNGKILGKETDGAQIVARRRYYVNGKERREKTPLPNPYYSYYITGYERKPWKWAVDKNISPRTGRGYAKKAVEQAQKIAKQHQGYYAVIIIAMPYATSKGLAAKTEALLRTAAKLKGKGFFKTITIDTSSGAFDYKKE